MLVFYMFVCGCLSFKNTKESNNSKWQSTGDLLSFNAHIFRITQAVRETQVCNVNSRRLFMDTVNFTSYRFGTECCELNVSIEICFL